MACFLLLGLSSRPVLAKYSWMRAQLSSCSISGISSTSQTVSRVRSSGVGPSPPVITTMSLRLSARDNTCLRRALLSPTVD